MAKVIVNILLPPPIFNMYSSKINNLKNISCKSLLCMQVSRLLKKQVIQVISAGLLIGANPMYVKKTSFVAYIVHLYSRDAKHFGIMHFIGIVLMLSKVKKIKKIKNSIGIAVNNNI